MEITMGGRTIPLTLTTFELIAIQEEIGCTVGQIRDQVFGIEHNLETDEYKCMLSTDKDKMRKFGTLIRIMGNAGLEEAGQEPDLTDKWILRHIQPAMIIPYVLVVSGAIDEAMHVESAGKPEGPVDEKLEEEKQKKEQESSPTGGSSPAD